MSNRTFLLGIKSLVPPWKPFLQGSANPGMGRVPLFLYFEVITWVEACFNDFKSFALQTAVVWGHPGRAFCHCAHALDGDKEQTVPAQSLQWSTRVSETSGQDCFPQRQGGLGTWECHLLLRPQHTPAPSPLSHTRSSGPTLL